MNITKLPIEGKTLSNIERKGEALYFQTTEGEEYRMYHSQDCCESVGIEDINGDLSDLVGVPLIVAEEVSNEAFEKEYESQFNVKNDYGEMKTKDGDYKPDSYTWTFYRLQTIKGTVDIRWFGESNGYYSESVDFVLVGGADDYGY